MSDDYWRTFIATASFMEPTTIEGVIEWLDRVKVASGTAPQLLIRLDSGQGLIVNVVQARLLEEFTRLRPKAGDRVKIVYRGEAERAAPGHSPTKQFDVSLVAKGSGPQAKGSQSTGEVTAMDGKSGDRK